MVVLGVQPGEVLGAEASLPLGFAGLGAAGDEVGGDLGFLGVDRGQIGDLGDGGLTAVAAELLGCIGVGSGRMAPKMWTNS